MQMAEEWLKTWICLSFLFAWAGAARPRFDVSTDMGMVLVPADAEVDTAIFRLRATDQDADFPLIFEIIATTSPIVRVENLPCTLYNKVCQANVILTRRLVPGRLHDFVVRVRDSKGDVNSMQATISVTNATTPRDKIFPHLPSLIMVPEDTKPEKELDYLLVESNPYSGKPVYIELWQPKELFKIRQRQMGSQTKGIITLIGELDFETQSMYTLTMYATDPYTEPGKDTRNIAGLHVVVVVQDVQDVPPVFTLAPPLTKINNTVKPGDVILRVHAEDGDKGVPREVTYGLISEGNPFTPFFNVSETTGEIILARPLEELTKITHVGAPIVLKIVAEEIRTMRDEPPAQATVVELGLLLGEPGNSPPYFENDNYVAWMDENAEPGTMIMFTDAYSALVRDEDIGKAGVFALKLENNNGTFEISPAVAERIANFIITVRDNSLIDYEKFKTLRFRIVAQEVGPATNLSTSVPVTIFLRDINDNPPVFDVPVYEVTLSENANAATRVVQVHATDKDAGVFGRIQYAKIIGVGSEALVMNPDIGLITVSMGSVLDREQTSRLELTVEARDEDGRGLRGVATLIVNILDVNDNEPIFEKGIYEFLLNAELKNFTIPSFIKAVDADVEPPNNIVRYEIVHGNYENKFQLNEETGELMLREAINKARKVRQNLKGNLTSNFRKQFRASNMPILRNQTNVTEITNSTSEPVFRDFHLLSNLTETDTDLTNQSRRRRAEDNPLFILTARAYDLGVPHLSSIAQIRILRPMSAFARIVMFVMPGENPDPKKTAETLATITGSRVTIQEIKPYVPQIDAGSNSDVGKRSVVVARVEQNGPGTLVDVDKIRTSLAANGFGILGGMDGSGDGITHSGTEDNISNSNSGRSNNKNVTVINSNTEEVTVYKAEKKLLTWLLVLLGLLLLAILIILIICCICPVCPFYMEPRKRRIHSSETLIVRPDGRPKRHMHRKPIKVINDYCGERREAWSADPARQHWQFNRRNTRHAGIASLPGDVVPGRQTAEVEHLRRVASLRLHDGNLAPPEPTVFDDRVIHQTRVIPITTEDERIYMEDIEAQNRNYDQAEIDSLRRHELDRGSDGVLRDGQRAMQDRGRQERVREQHFYRDGNAEVLRLVTRGEIEDRDRAKELYHANGKDILLQRFIEDQKLRRSQDLRDSFHESLHEADVNRSMESHQRLNGPAEILIIPEILELQRQPSYNQRQHQQEQMMNADVQRLIIEHNYKSKGEEGADESYRSRGAPRVSMRDAEVTAGDAARSMENLSGRERNAPYAIHDAELMRQNALLTRLLLEKEARDLNVPMVDSSSFLETQSLPGQVAIATQTDRTAATQTECISRSRSDNEESEEDPRLRLKPKLKGKLETKEDFRKMKKIWVRTPIPEESRAQSGTKKVTPTRTKIEVLESRKVSISPDVLKEITNSLKSGDSAGTNEDEGDEKDEVPEERKADKVTSSKTVCTSQKKKKVKEATKIDHDSTTPSPETEERSALMKGKIRKKIEKPPRAKKLEKTVESEKSHFMDPSFRVLEREISSFQQKIRQFGDKKLKMLKKEDSGKGDKESDDDGATYGVSQKCEVTVKKSKKSVSREASPTKISVDQRTKTSEEETKSRQQRNISSSDFEDFEKPKGEITNFSERTTQCAKSNMQIRSQSKLNKQMHLESSDAKSSNEKIEKSQDSESKTDKSKDSSSCVETKTDSPSSSGKDDEKRKKMQVQEKKNTHSQKVTSKTKKAGIVGIKRKLTSSLKSKTVDERMQRTSKKEEKAKKTKSSTSDESKLTSPSKSKESIYQKKSVTPEEKKSHRMTKSSTSRESMGLDIDKLVKDVRGALRKEISSLTQAAKDALNIKKSEESVDKKDAESQKPKEVQKIQAIGDSKNQNHSIDVSKREIEKMKSTEKETKLKSTDSKEKREKFKNLKQKSKSTESTSSTKIQKSDEAISFIVIENNRNGLSVGERNKEYEASAKETKKADTIQPEITKDNQNSKTKENLSKKESDSNSKDTFEIEETAKMVSDEINETKKIASDKIDETKKSVSGKINEAKKTVSDKINETKKDVNDSINKTKESISDKIDEIKENVAHKIGESKKNIIEKIDGTKKIISDKIDELDQKRENVSEKVSESTKELKDQIGETKVKISENINKISKVASDEINEAKSEVCDKIKETKRAISDEIDETKKMVSDKFDETKENISDKIDNTQKFVSDETRKDVSEKFDGLKSTATNQINDSEKIITEKIEKTKEIVTEKIDKTTEEITNEIKENKQSASDKFEETNKGIKDVIADSKKAVEDKFHQTTAYLSDKIDQEISGLKELPTEKMDVSPDTKVTANATVPKIESKAHTSKEVDHTNSKIDLSQLKSASLPNQTQCHVDKKAVEIKVEINKESKEIEEQTDKNESTEVRTLNNTYVKAVTKDILEIEKINSSISQQDETTSRESMSISLTKQPKESELLNKADSTPSSDSSKPALPPETTRLNQMKEGESETQETQKFPTKLPSVSAGESDEEDSSSASDISNKTALRTSKPYSTPRHSISSDGGGGEELPAKSSRPPRQRWDVQREPDPLCKADADDASKVVFPQKIEMAPMDKPKVSASTPALDQPKGLKSSSADESRKEPLQDKSMGQTATKVTEVPDKQRPDHPKSRPVVVSIKRKEQQQQHLRTDHISRHTESRKASPRRGKPEDKKAQTHSEERCSKSTTTTTPTTIAEQRKEIRSKHLKLHVSHHYQRPKDESNQRQIPIDDKTAKTTPAKETKDEDHRTQRIIDYGKDPEVANARSRYMAWYQQKRAEMERKRKEKKEAEEEQQRPKWAKKQLQVPGKSRKAKSAEEKEQRDDEAKASNSRERTKSTSDATPSSTRVTRLRIRPLVNIESEQLKAIVRQGRKLRRAEGAREEDPPVQIFAPEKPPEPTTLLLQLEPRHHLTQHSEHKYEKLVPPPALPFYLHPPPPPPPHPSPEHLQDDSSDSRRLDDDLDSGIAVSLQGSTRLRHQQLLDKKSVFDIAYNEASPTQLRSDSSTPPT